MIRRYELTVTVKGPIFTRSNAIGLFGIDAPIARNAAGCPYLPNTLVIGRIAEALRQLGAAQRAASADCTCLDDLRDFFAAGDESNAAGDDDFGRERRRRIFVSDLVAQQAGLEPSIDAIRTRIEIDQRTGAVKKGSIQAIEAPYKVGEMVEFVGELRLLGLRTRLVDFEKRLRKALSWISQWGAMRGMGYGEAVSATLSPLPEKIESQLERPQSRDAPSPGPAVRMRMTLNMRDIFCVGESRIDANTYLSSDIISGGVIKGAIAAQILAGASSGGTSLRKAQSGLDAPFQPLAEFFDDITIRHALPRAREPEPGSGEPRSEGQRLTLPLSLAFVSQADKKGENKLLDAARLSHPQQAFMFAGNAPRFEPDWKDVQRRIAKAAYGQCTVPSSLRLRTKIDAERRAADTGKLFGIRYCEVGQHRWIAEVDLARVPEDRRAAVWSALDAATRDGLVGIGRGGAFAEVQFQPASSAARIVPDTRGRYALMLVTPALIRRPDPSRRDDVTADYAKAFKDLAVPLDNLSLKAIFVRERLAGADFMARRLPEWTPYRPFLLTEAGSVFVFEADARGADILQLWLEKGLSIPPSTLAFYALDQVDDPWSCCPYLPQNGFGELVMLPDCEGVEGFVSATDEAVTFVSAAGLIGKGNLL